MCLKSPHPKPGQREGPSIDTITLMSQVFLLMVAFTPVGKFIWATNVCKVKVHLAFQEVKVHQNHGMCYSPPVQKALLCSVCTGRKRKALRTESRGLFKYLFCRHLFLAHGMLSRIVQVSNTHTEDGCSPTQILPHHCSSHMPDKLHRLPVLTKWWRQTIQEWDCHLYTE